MTRRADAGRSSSPLRRWAVAATMGGFVFGYQIGVVSGALLYVRRDFGLTSLEQGVLVGLLPLGALAGSLVNGRLADGIGRRRTLIVAALVLLAGTALAASAPDYAVLLAARAIIGLGVGSVSSTVPLYLSEIAPPDVRGRLVTTNQVMLALGIVVSYLVDLAFSSSGSWRLMFAVGAVPAVALLAGMARAPESPVWLYAHGRHEEARRVIGRVAGDEQADRQLEGFRTALDGGAGRPVLATLASAARPQLLIGITLAAVQQFSGINGIISYAPSIMEHTGLSASSSIISSVAIGAVNVAATIVAVRYVERLGRRALLLVSLGGMFVALAFLGLTFAVPHGVSGSWLSLLCLVVYVAAFAFGLGPVVWVLISEIFPPRARAAGASVSTATIWLSNVVVGVMFLPLVGAVGAAATFWIFAAVCAFGFVFVYRWVPETRGRSFAEIDADVHARWGRAGESPLRRRRASRAMSSR